MHSTKRFLQGGRVGGQGSILNDFFLKVILMVTKEKMLKKWRCGGIASEKTCAGSYHLLLQQSGHRRMLEVTRPVVEPALCDPDTMTKLRGKPFRQNSCGSQEGWCVLTNPINEDTAAVSIWNQQCQYLAGNNSTKWALSRATKMSLNSSTNVATSKLCFIRCFKHPEKPPAYIPPAISTKPHILEWTYHNPSPYPI